MAERKRTTNLHQLDDAAARALWALADAPVEHIGLLYEQDGRILATPAQTRGRYATTGGTFQIPAGSLRGIFHNHPARRSERGDLDAGRRDRQRTKFSPDDYRQAKRLGVPSYIAAGPKLLRRYDPATGRTEDVLAMIPIEELLRLHAARNPLMAAYLAQRDQGQTVAANGNSNAR